MMDLHCMILCRTISSIMRKMEKVATMDAMITLVGTADSKGTPMMLMGDEYGHTQFGNNNSYGHDTAINHFQWTKLEEKKGDHFRFFAEAIKFCRRRSVFKCEHFLGQEDVTWHEDNWSNDESKFLAFT